MLWFLKCKCGITIEELFYPFPLLNLEGESGNVTLRGNNLGSKDEEESDELCNCFIVVILYDITSSSGMISLLSLW